MHYIFCYWYSLGYSKAYHFINVVVIVFDLCCDPVYSMSSFCILFQQTDLTVEFSCVTYVIRCYVIFFVCVICCAVLYYRYHRVDNPFEVK
jgi:hypothetical protein